MRKYLLAIFIIVLYSCSSNKATNKPLYEVLSVNNDGGANIKFYEILTEAKEIRMLLGDDKLRRKIKERDVNNSNFIILNTGPTTETINKIKIEKVLETPTQIEIYVNDTQKNIDINRADDETLYPYTIVKVNSKKPIIIK